MYLAKLQNQEQQDRLAILKTVLNRYHLVRHEVEQLMEEGHQWMRPLVKEIWLHMEDQIVHQG